MAITHFGSISNPLTTSANGSSPAAVAPPASMVEGDLALFIGVAQSATGTMAVSEAGGQTWSALTQRQSGGMTSQVFWCRFDGTWDASPSLAFDGTLTNGFSAILHVWRPTTGTNTWAVDVAQTNADIPGGNATVTIAGITRSASGALAVAVWAVDNDVTWSSLAGTGWSTIGDLSHRNLQGNDLGASVAHNIGDGATNDVSLNTNDTGALGHSWILAFKEVAAGGGGGTILPFMMANH